MTCHITGSVVIPDGSSAANRKIVFRKEEFTLSANGTIAVLPDYITTYTNASGNVSFDLLEGTYSGYYVTAPDGRVPFRLRVPTGTATANFADLIITTSVADDPTLTKLVLDAKAVIDGGGGGGGGAAAWGSITGTLSSQTDLQTALNGKQPLATVLTNTTASYTTAEQTKLGSIASGATANSPDATLLARANHTGTQAASTITGLATVATSGLFSDLGSKPTTLAGYGITDGATTSALTSGLATKANTATTLAGYGITDGLTTTAAASTYQPLDGDLTALAGVTGTNTIYYRSAADTWSPVTIGSNLTFSGGTLAASGGGGAWTPFSISVNSTEGVPCTTYGSSAAPANQSTALNAMDIYPWICPVNMTISSVSIRVNTVLASSTCKVVFYTSNASGQPNTLMFETAEADTSTTGVKTLTASASFTAGTLYWVGMRSNLASIGMFAFPGSATPDIGPATGAGTNVLRKMLRRTLTYSTAAPTTWGYTYSEVNAALPWMIWATKA